MVCDSSEARLNLVKQNVVGVRSFTTSTDEAIQDPLAQAVVIATPVVHHFELAKRALLAGKHVLVEKPLCRTTEQAIELDQLAQDRELILAVGHIFLFNPGIQAVKRTIDSGQLGKLLYIFSTRTNLGPFRSDVNAMWDLASHDLSIFDYWLGEHPTSCTANGQTLLGGKVEDVVMASFAYPSKVVASVHASWLNPRKVREITVVGQDQMLLWDDLDLTEPVRIYQKSVTKDGSYSDSFGTFRMQLRQGDVISPFIVGPEPLAAECAHFIDSVKRRCQPRNSAAGATAVIRSLEAADRSMAQASRWVNIE